MQADCWQLIVTTMSGNSFAFGYDSAFEIRDFFFFCCDVFYMIKERPTPNLIKTIKAAFDVGWQNYRIGCRPIPL
jgi:hypothetical protein